MGHSFESMTSLRKYIDWAVYDYNVLRPHYKHRPRTPEEVYFGRKLDFDLRERVITGVRNRLEANKRAKCIQCKDRCADKHCLTN